MTYRVVQWSTGNVGRHSLVGIDARPDLELVGVWVSSDAKAGKDAGELAGLNRPLGVTATTDAEALLALRPDCIVHTAMADHRLTEALDDLARRAGDTDLARASYREAIAQCPNAPEQVHLHARLAALGPS